MIRFRVTGHEGLMPGVGLSLADAVLNEANGLSRSDRADVRLKVLIETHYEFVWRSLRRLGVREGDVDDGVQKVFLVASRKLDAIRADRERPFLYQTALRIAADSRRAERRRHEGEPPDADVLVDPSPGPDDLVDLRRARRCLDAILDQWPIELRAVFTLFELDQLTLSEIAGLLGIPRGTVASRLRRARREFYEKAREFLADRGEEGT